MESDMPGRRAAGKVSGVIMAGLLWIVTAAAYHGEEETVDIVVSLSPVELTVFSLAPLAIVSALTYKLLHPVLVDRYAGDSVLEPGEKDIRKYSVLGSVAAGVAAAFTGLYGAHSVDLAVFGAGAVIGLIVVVVLYRDVIQERAGFSL